MDAKPRVLAERYELVSCIARGGMGEVWKTFDRQLARHVAIKLLRPDHLNMADFVTRFAQEARLIASLSHPNIVKIHNFHAEAEPPLFYMVMDYIEGQTLADYIRDTSRQGRFPSASDILYIFTAVGLALDYAHQRGMVHRDIKPANILLDQRMPGERPFGKPVLTDFGIARRLSSSSGTAIGSVLGTPTYIAPEQALGRATSPRSDLYSLGIILYEMLAGVPPFRGDSPLAIIMMHAHENPPPPETINPRITPELSRVILTCIAKQPEERFPNAAALVSALAQALGLPVPAALSRSAESGGPFSQSLSGINRSVPATPFLALEHTPGYRISNSGSGPISQSPLPGDFRRSDPASQPHLTPTTTPGRITGEVPSRPVVINKKWFLLVALVFVVIAGSVLSYLLLFSHTGNNTPAVVGSMKFTKGATDNKYPSVQIDISSIAVPPDGKMYYAWIIVPDEYDIPHWQLSVKNQAIHTQSLTFSGFDNLLFPDSMLLITSEQDGTPPVVPDTALQSRLYYARVSKNPAPIQDLYACPTDGSQVCV